MGWDFCDNWTTRTMARNAAIDGIKRSGTDVLEVASGKKSAYWLLCQQDGKRFVAVVLTSKSGKAFGYKLLTEYEHPYYYDVPKNFLAQLSPPTTESSRKWREIALNA